MLRSILGCRGQQHLHALTPQEVPDLQWNVCPLDLLDAPFLRQVETLDRLAKVAPLDGWPTKFSAWAVAGVLSLRADRGEV